jgi:hypothetical protein
MLKNQHVLKIITEFCIMGESIMGLYHEMVYYRRELSV